MSKKPSSTKRGYDSRWQKARLTFLAKNQLCVYCLKQGYIQGAEVVDHIVPHRGDMKLFWDVDNWQALCRRCHASTKQMEEKAEGKPITGLDGWPI